jgi:hypothetical protein
MCITATMNKLRHVFTNAMTSCLRFFTPIIVLAIIYTQYIHSVVVQDFVSGGACCVNQDHYESRQQRVVMRFVHTTGKTWYKVLYKHTMYVISLSNISIKTNFKQITQLVAVATRSDPGSHNRLHLIQSLVPPHYVCIGYILWQEQFYHNVMMMPALI